MGMEAILDLHSSRGVVRMAERKWRAICGPEHQRETRQYSSSDHAGETVSSTAALRIYLVDFILDDVAQLRPLYAVIQSISAPENDPEDEISHSTRSVEEMRSRLLSYSNASGDTGWTSGSRWRVDRGFTAPHLGTTENPRT